MSPPRCDPGLRGAVTALWLITSRELLRLGRRPVWLVLNLVQPLMYVLLLPELEKIVRATPGFPPGDGWAVFVPALLLQSALINATFVGVGMRSEVENGALDQLRVTPVGSPAIIGGKVFAVVLNVVVQGALIAAMCSLVFGMSLHFPGVVACLAVSALFAATVASFSYCVSLRLRNANVLPVVLNAFFLPALATSGMFFPITRGLAPNWLYELSRVNPVTYVVDGARELFRDDFGRATLLKGFVPLAVLLAIGIILATRGISRRAVADQ